MFRTIYYRSRGDRNAEPCYVLYCSVIDLRDLRKRMRIRHCLPVSQQGCSKVRSWLIFSKIQKYDNGDMCGTQNYLKH